MEFADALANSGMAKNGERILSPSTVRLMHTNFLSESQRQSMRRLVFWLPGYGYGLGVRSLVSPTEAGAKLMAGYYLDAISPIIDSLK